MTATSNNFNETAPAPSRDYVFTSKTDADTSDIAIQLDGTTVKVQTEDVTLIDNATLTINKGAKVAFTGPNGSGKTSLFRVIRELWDHGTGDVGISAAFNDGNTLCASQEIRKTPTTLPGLLSYPKNADAYAEEDYEAVLKEVGLDAAIAHLPWNAVKPENVVRIARTFIEKELEEYKGIVSPGCAKDMLESFRKTMLKKFSMPRVLEDYATDEQMNAIVDALTDYAATRLESDPKKQDILVLFASRAGRIAAKKVAEQAKYAVDGWLLQGQRMPLSGGQQQKLIFARKLLQKPELLLLDEVTSALKGDAAHERLGHLFEQLPNSTASAIIHDESLLTHFTHHMQLDDNKKLTITKLDHGTPAAPKPQDNAPRP